MVLYSKCKEKKDSCEECRKWASYMPGYFYTWYGPNAEDNPYKCALKKKSNV